MEKFQEYLQEAERIIQKVDHLLYMTYPLIKDKRLLLKALVETKVALVYCINSILYRENYFKRISLSRDAKINLKVFIRKCSQRYGITDDEISLILELFDIVKKHNQSSMEFMREEKLAILSETLKPKLISIDKTKEFLLLAKNIIIKTKKIILG